MAEEPDQVAVLRLALDEAGNPWTAETTPLATLSTDEKRLRLGYTPGPSEPSLAERHELATAGAARAQARAIAAGAQPARVDLRDDGYITSIKDQGACGSCVAFGCCAATEGTLRRATESSSLIVDLAEAHLFYCHARAQGRRCSGAKGGWWVAPALDAMRDIGVASEECYPYTAGDQECTGLCADWRSNLTRVTGWHPVDSQDAMREWLATKGPLVTCMTVYDDFYAYREGVYEQVSGENLGGHCICVVGYDHGQGHWICKNSWGTRWGERGFFRIAYGQVGIDATMWAIDGVSGSLWVEGRQVIGLWANDKPQNVWAYLEGLGWRRLAPDSEPITARMLTVAAGAKTAHRSPRLRLEGPVIRQMHVT